MKIVLFGKVVYGFIILSENNSWYHGFLGTDIVLKYRVRKIHDIKLRYRSNREQFLGASKMQLLKMLKNQFVIFFHLMKLYRYSSDW